MSTILELPEVQSRLARWSVDEYEQLAEQGIIAKNSELLRGLVVAKMPKSPLHRALAKRLYDRLQAGLPPGFVVFQEAPLRLADSEPEPDVAIVRGREEDFLRHHPTTAALVIEVAVTSAALDRANASLYAEAGVEEYWIVMGVERTVEVFRSPAGGAYRECQLVAAVETLQSAAVPGVAVSLPELFG